MGIFDRLRKLVTSNANAALDKLEDPALQVDQLILDMEEQRRRARQETQRGMAAEKLAAQRVEAAENQVADWGRKAETAVRHGDDELAREAILAQQQAEQQLAQARREHAEAGATASAQKAALAKLDDRLRQARMKQGTIKAKISMSKNVTVSAASLDDFERMAERVDASESTLEAQREMAALDEPSARDALVDAKLARLDQGAGDEVDDRLAALKTKLEPRK